MRHASLFSGIVSELKSKTARENLKKALASRMKNSHILMICACCGKKVSVTKAYLRKGWKYCSWECRVKHMRGSNAPNYGGGQHMIGENNPNYKDGKGLERSKTRDIGKINKWRRMVFERDNYKCQKCGYSKGHILVAHHIKLFSKYESERYDVSNGITLCAICHKWVHGNSNIENELICR